MLICAGCLGSRSDDSNEIVECDGCGITVHEGLYNFFKSNNVTAKKFMTLNLSL